MRILELDLGKFKTVACQFVSQDATYTYQKVDTTPQSLHDLIVDYAPDRVVFEICSCAGWVHDLVCALGIEVQVANPNEEGWRWRNVRRKNDRLDALKLARYSAQNDLKLVHMPSPQVRQWRAFIHYRKSLVDRRTAIKNHIRSMLERAGLRWPSQAKGWCKQAVADLHELAHNEDRDPLWRTELRLELQGLASIEELIQEAEVTLGEFARSRAHVGRLQSIPGVGPRVAEAIVAILDDPHRFRSARQVGSYVGLTPHERQSGQQNRIGRISRQGNCLLRSLLIEVSWNGLRYNPWMLGIYQRVQRGSPSRKKIAIVAVARQLLIRCWVLMKREERWHPPAVLRVA